MCVPRISLRELIIKEYHAGGLAGHHGRDKTTQLIQESFFWPKVTKDIGHWIQRCAVCQLGKSHSLPQGLLFPLPVPDKPWESVSMDFVVCLPRTQGGKDSILVVVDRFSKMAQLIACHTSNDATQIANLYFKEVVKLQGIPRSIVSDRDSKFLSHLLVTLWKKLVTKLQFNTSCHPKTDGQTKIVNRTLGTLLRSLITQGPKQWEVLLPHAELAYNIAPHKVTGYSPFETVYGLNPLSPVDLAPISTPKRFSQDAADRAKEKQKLHEDIKSRIEKTNEKLKERLDKKKRNV